jgi:hypothetical protein
VPSDPNVVSVSGLSILFSITFICPVNVIENRMNNPETLTTLGTQGT